MSKKKNNVIRKFFDAEGKETTPDKAVRCDELELDADGRVVKDTIYTVKRAHSRRKGRNDEKDAAVRERTCAFTAFVFPRRVK